MPPIHRLLIANRAEIACRIARTARSMGIVTIAVFTDVDRGALHVTACDEATFLGDEGHGSPYLNIAAILDAARRMHADAIHPGFGFLSERADFALAVYEAGLNWVGPTPAVMHALGRKDKARALAKQHGVPVVPGVDGQEKLPDAPNLRAKALDELVDLAAFVDFPLLIKAVAGGGGRGMRVVSKPERLREELDIAAREAQAAFGDGTLLIEHYVERGRHIEVQIIGDAHGNVLHLGERECSIQRRHQKIVEESPSPGVAPQLRERLCDAAVRLCKGVGYTSAGTVEFLVNDDTGEFYFLEVNTRLQVEHGVSELVTGLDIVQLQLQIAQRQALQIDQSEVQFRGHALEVRLCAEDPLRDFAPQSGNVALWQPPAGAGTRVDHGMHAQDSIAVHYDAMVAKVLTYGADRATAIGRMEQALRQLRLWGLASNRAYLLQIIRERDFRNGVVTTGYVATHPPAVEPPEPIDLVAGALWRHGQALQKRFRNNGWRPDVTLLQTEDGNRHAVALAPDGGSKFRFGVAAFDEPLLTQPPTADREVALVGCDGDLLVLDIATARHRWSIGEQGPWLFVQHSSGRAVTLTELSLLPEPAVLVASSGGVVAIGAAVVTVVHTKAGDVVVADQPMITLEAMKMMSVLRAPRDGTVAAVYAQVGDAVAAGALLVELVPQ